jgi:hypothetical protein
LLDNASRAAMTVSRRDCDLIPRWGSHFIRRQARRILHNGVRIVAVGYYSDWMTGIIERLRGHHEPQEEVVFHEVLRHLPPMATMLELGSFKSYYSLWFKSQLGEQREAYGRQMQTAFGMRGWHSAGSRRLSNFGLGSISAARSG